MSSFTALDFETAQPQRSSICQVGLVRVVEGTIVDHLNLLIQPPQNNYWSRFTAIHGISARDTLHAPTFAEAWPQILPFIENQVVVAHNGFSFDFPVLHHTLSYYDLPTPSYRKYCTYRIYGQNLKALCTQYEIPLNHHDALSDAKACTALFQMHLEKLLP